MNEHEAHEVIKHYPRRVVARYADGSIRAEGVAISYSIVPVIDIQTDDGERVSWRHDMVEGA